jgi:hypothetical protein
VNKELTPEAHEDLLARLLEPFDPALVLWSVNEIEAGGARGKLVTYVQAKNYHDRLNKLFSTDGWSAEYSTEMVCNITRIKRNQKISTGKLVVICKLTISGFGTHSSTGEQWADNDNAMTTAESQAFKRACSSFGLGRYLAEIEKPLVDLDKERKPKALPTLPEWALPHAKADLDPQPSGSEPQPQALPAKDEPASAESRKQATQIPALAAQPAATSSSQGQAPQKSTNTATTLQPLAKKPEQELAKRFAALKLALGRTLHDSIIAFVSNGFATGTLLVGEQGKNGVALTYLDRGKVSIEEIRRLAEEVGEQQFAQTLDEFNVPSLDCFASIDQLNAVHKALVSQVKIAA